MIQFVKLRKGSIKGNAGYLPTYLYSPQLKETSDKNLQVCFGLVC